MTAWRLPATDRLPDSAHDSPLRWTAHLLAAAPENAALALGLLAAALLVGGPRPGAGRLTAVLLPRSRESPRTADVQLLRPAWVVVAALAVGALGAVVAGPVAAVVAATVGVAGGIVLRRRGRPPPGTPGPELAAAWELLALCLRSGLPVADAVAAAAPPGGPVGGALHRVADLLALGADPAEAWQACGAVPELATFSRAAGRSAATGTALARVAGAEGSRIRSELVDAAQARAERAGVLITGPLGLCFLPAFLVLGIAPVVIGLAGEALARW